jgi:hypothetical protein
LPPLLYNARDTDADRFLPQAQEPQAAGLHAIKVLMLMDIGGTERLVHKPASAWGWRLAAARAGTQERGAAVHI